MEKLSNVIKTAVKLREESFDWAAYAENITCFEKFYTLSLLEAVEKACKIHGCAHCVVQPAYLLIKHSWDEAITWAEELQDEISQTDES